jgi:peptidyl-prolyl cis-trans isomerase C
MSNKIVAILAVPLVALAWFAGFKTGERTATASGSLLPVSSRPGTPVATFDGQSISVEELKAQIEEQSPLLRSRYASSEGRREMLERLVRTELLAREAQKRGYNRNPDVLNQNKRNMIAVFVQKEFDEAQQKQPVPEDQIKSFYDAHIHEYVKPERVRAAQIFFAAPASDAKARAEKKALAEKTFAELEKNPTDFTRFHQLARERSDDQESKAGGGDLRFQTRQELEGRVGPELAEVAWSMSHVGQLLDHVVEAPDGFHIITLLGRENALNLSLDEVRDAVRSRIVFEQRSTRYQQFVEQLEKQAGLKIDTARLGEMKLELPPATPPPGAIPPAPSARGAGPSPSELNLNR